MKSMSGMPLVAAAMAFGLSAVVLGATVLDALQMDDTSNLVGSEEQSPQGSAEVAGASETGVVAPDAEGAIPEVETVPVEGEGTVAGEASLVVPLRGVRYPQVTNDEILDAVNQDLFQPDRTPPLQRYQFPGERPSEAQIARDIRRRSEPDLRIVGTAIAGDLALAMVQPDDSIPFAVLRGEAVDGWLLAAVTEEWVTLSRDGSEFTLPVREPQRGRSSNDRRGNDRSRNAEAEAARALSERLQQMLQGARGQAMRRGGSTVELPAAAFYERGSNLSVAVPVTVRGGRPGGGGGGGEDSK